MPQINLAYVQGYLVKDPELKFIPSGTALCQFSLAHSRSWQKAGEWQKEVSYIDVKCWSELAERAGRDLTKGSHVVICGRMVQERWTAADGSARSKLLIIGDRIDLVSSPTAKDARSQANPPPGDDDIPF